MVNAYNHVAIERGQSFLDDDAEERMHFGHGTETHTVKGNPERYAPPEGDAASLPQPLPKLPPVPAMDLSILPDRLRPSIEDASERARFRPDFAAVAGMAALGSVIGRKIGIRLKCRDDWTEYANIWSALVGPPSSLKSPAIRAATSPFKKLQVSADAAYANAAQVYEAAMESAKLRHEARKKRAVKVLANDPEADVDLSGDVAEDAPVPRCYWTSNVNEASLGVLLAQNPNGLLIERDELSSLLVRLEDENAADLRGMMLSGWSGQEGYRFDRIQRGVTMLPKFALSVVGGIQPGPLARYVRSAHSGERADGMLQRFQLIVWPDSEPFAYVDRYPNSQSRQEANKLFEWADTFDPVAMGSADPFGNDSPFVRLSEPAQVLFVDWYTGSVNVKVVVA